VPHAAVARGGNTSQNWVRSSRKPTKSEHWLLVLIESEIASGPEVNLLFDEACQLRAIFKASHDTARMNDQRVEDYSDPKS
jgi:hypothetical protein